MSVLSKKRLSSARDLVEAGLVDDAAGADIDAVGREYAIGVSAHVAALARGSEAVARQYVPDVRELDIKSVEMDDPIGDDVHSPVKGVVHRYPDRVLLKATHVCAVYCRYCFRREMVGQDTDQILSHEEMVQALDYIRSRPEIWEVILTGGDPFVLSARQMGEILQGLQAIPHVKVVRFHTRVPIADPGRVSADLCEILQACDKAVYVALHVNHPDEITPEVECALADLRAAGCVLLSQSVLLRGVNDDADVLEALMRRLVELSVKPYYIHHPDMARGTAHFRLSIAHGQEVMRALLGRVSGLCQPSYMLDIPGGYGKVSINPYYLDEGQDGTMIVEDYQGNRHFYQDGI